MRPEIGIQLYTVREDLKNDFHGTLRALADMGYAGVEFAWNYGGKSPEALAAFLKETGLACCGVHAGLDELQDAKSGAYAYARALESPCVTTSLAQEVARDWAAAIRGVAEAGAVARSLGLRFTYHNHAQELETIDGQPALDRLFAATDPDAVGAELDTCWIARGGRDPAVYLRRYADRTPQLHVKDMDESGAFVPVGSGCLDWNAILAASADTAVAWWIVEQDRCDDAPLACAERSLAFLRAFAKKRAAVS